MAKRNYRADNTYLIEGNCGDNPKLMGRVLSDGRDSLYLEFYHGKVEVTSKNGNTYLKNERENEVLGLYLWRAPRTAQERKQNKETLEIAKRIRFERGQELLEQGEGYRLKKTKNVNILKWMETYYSGYDKADKRIIKHAIDCFISYLVDPSCELVCAAGSSKEQIEAANQEKAVRIARLNLSATRMNKALIVGFVAYLQRRFVGEGPHSVFKRFKKIVAAAVEAGVLKVNPCQGVVIRIDTDTLKKDILSIDEIQRLMATHYPGENIDVRRAFIFCLYCGLRWCDVKDLTYANVDFSNKLLTFEQSKTKGHSRASNVVIPLNDGLLELIGKGNRGEVIFPLPSHTMCLKALRRWVARAGIDKHITWHCARHSFAVNILNNGANIKTVASLLGHSGLSQTEKYTRAVDSLKEAAINSLPELKM
ncbi:MAG: site-specific integrase [Duncaniella sp.]|nr:site-specific integrase [Duncaniella sp.]